MSEMIKKAGMDWLPEHTRKEKLMKNLFNGMNKFLILSTVVASATLLYSPLVSAAPILGSAKNFAVLAASTVTNGHSDPNPTTQIYGNLGVTPGTLVTGFNPGGTVSGGTIHIDDGVAQLALINATTAYNTLAGLPASTNLTDQDLGGMVLMPGVYHFDTSAQLTGILTLDFQSNPNAEFIFQIGSTFTTATGSSVNVINGNSLSGVSWQVGSSATLGTDTMLAGNILAWASVSLDPRAAILCGRAFALNGAVTLTDNLISDNCTAGDFGSGRSDFGSYGFSSDNAGPVVDIKANGLDGPLSVGKKANLTLVVTVDAAGAATNSDWWLKAETSFGTYSFNAGTHRWSPGLTVAYQGPLMNLAPYEVLNMRGGLPVGTYDIMFGVDSNMNGVLDNEAFISDSVSITVIP